MTMPLPLPWASSTAQPSSSRGGSGGRGSGKARGRGNIAGEACGPCRKARVKCSSSRPACERCLRLNLSCTYETRSGETRMQAKTRKLYDYKGDNSQYRELVECIRSFDPAKANDIFQRIRYGYDPQAILTQIRTGDLGSQLHLRPEAQYRYELPHSKQMPRELIYRNPYLETLIYENASLDLAHPSHDRFEAVANSPSVIYLRPYHAARIIDPLIEDAKPSLWTTICQDDGIMRRLLKNLFLCEFYFMSALQKDLFLEDMIRGQGEFCSSLLVNAVMAYACVCDPDIPERAEYWNPRSLTYRFLMEAKRLWELEGATPLISTIQAGFILNGMSNLSGLDEIGQMYRTQTLALANRLGLYYGPVRATSERSKQGAIYTAWALFCWDALLAFSLQQPPFLKGPPHDPLPSSVTNPDWYGRFWLQYPGHEHAIDAQFGVVFEHRAHFRVILAQYCRAAYGGQKVSPMTTNEAYDYHSRLVRWFESLPTSLQPENIVLPAQLQLHMYYHHLMVNIFEPLCTTETLCQPQPAVIAHGANKCFATLFRLYYIRHGHQNMDIHIIISLIFFGTRCLDAIQRHPQGPDLESLRSTLILCATGLYSQRQNNYLAHALYSALRGRMRPEEVALLKQVPDLQNDEEALKVQQTTRSNWIPTVMRVSEVSDPPVAEDPVLWRPA